MVAANKGVVTGAIIAGIAGTDGEGIQGGDILITREATPDVRVVGLDASGQRRVTPNLLTVPSGAAFDALLVAASDCTAALAGGAVNTLVGEFALTYGPNGIPAPSGTSVLVAYACSAPVVVTLDAGSSAGSELVGQAINGDAGLVWARVGVSGSVRLLFTATTGDSLDVWGQQSAGLGAVGSMSAFVP